MCECKELIDKDESDKGFIWNPSNCKCECNKSCDIGEYLDYWNCKWRKKLVNKLIEECTENVEETKLVEKTPTENVHKCSSCTLCIVLFWIFFIFSANNTGIGIYFTYYKYISHNKENLKHDDTRQTTIWWTYKWDILKK